MKKLISIIIFLLFSSCIISAQGIGATRGVVDDAVPGDNVLRFYRMAIPVTNSAFEEDFNGDYTAVQLFWRECEELLNRVFVPVGFCFDVIEDERLLLPTHYDDYSVFTLDTELLNGVMDSDDYDIGMWVTHRSEESDNTGQSVTNGAYSRSTKANGYAKPDSWVVAHEVGHLLGADHTVPGEGSLMDNSGEYLSYPSIRKIRTACLERNAAYYSDKECTELVGVDNGGNYVYGVEVANTAPVFVAELMNDCYRIPQGACLSVNLHAEDVDDNALMYMSAGKDVELVASLAPQGSPMIDYRPQYSADIFYPEYFYPVTGTDIPALESGCYDISLIVYDHPRDCSLTSMMSSPFYCNYAVWDAVVEVVGGVPFYATVLPAKECYVAGERVKVCWGVNVGFFGADSRVRVTMSDDYGKSFKYLLADDVPALDGCVEVVLPDVNVGDVDVDFITAVRAMPGGVIRVEEIGGIAYTLTALSPQQGGSFNITGGTGMSDIFPGDCGQVIYDLQGRPMRGVVSPGIYIKDGRKVVVM